MRALIAGGLAGVLAAGLLTGCSEAPELKPRTLPKVAGEGPSPKVAHLGPHGVVSGESLTLDELVASHKGKVVLGELWGEF